MKVPADLYRPSPHPYHGLEEFQYPFHDWSVVVTHCGRICFKVPSSSRSSRFETALDRASPSSLGYRLRYEVVANVCSRGRPGWPFRAS
jgi:hypothetical protein